MEKDTTQTLIIKKLEWINKYYPKCIYTSNRPSKFMNEMLTEEKGKNGASTITVRVFNIPLRN